MRDTAAITEPSICKPHHELSGYPTPTITFVILRRSGRTCGCSFSRAMSFMHEGGYGTYIMASRSHTLSIGVTRDLLRRVFQHKWREHEGFISRYNCDGLVWFERRQDVQKAIAREKELKEWRRTKKIVLIETSNPTWQDLSRD